MSDSFTPGTLDSFTPDVKPDSTPGLGTKVLGAIETPERGMRGVGVGLERLLSPVTPAQMSGLPIAPPISPAQTEQVGQQMPTALDRAAAAVKPGYEPLPGEKLGAYIGSTVGSLPVASLLSGAGDAELFKAIPYGLKTLYSVTRGALSGGTLAAIHDAGEKGAVDITNMAHGAEVGSAIPLIRPASTIIKNVIDDVSEMLPKGTSVQPFATSVLKENPRLLGEMPGTAESVGQKIEDVQKSLIGLERKAGAALAPIKASYGIPVTHEELTKKILAEGTAPHNAESALALWEQTQPDKNPDFASLPNEVKIKQLWETKQALEDGVNFPKMSTNVPPIGTAVEGVLKQKMKEMTERIADAGGKDLNQAAAYYSTVRHLRDGLQKKLATAGQAEQTIMHVVKNGDLEDIIGMDKDVVDQIKQLEQETGTNLLEPLRKDLAAKNLNEMRATWYRGFAGRALGKEGMQVAIPTLDKAGKAVQWAGQFAGTPLAKTALTSALTNPELSK